MTGPDVLFLLILLCAFGSGYLMGHDHGHWKAEAEYWRRRDAEWDAKHLAQDTLKDA